MTHAPLVVVVEDDPGVMRAMTRMLRLNGFEPAAYGAAEDLLRGGGVPDGAVCLVVDIQLPRMSGLALVEHLGETHALPPVIFITASDDPELRAEAARLGAAFLAKPFSGHALVAAVREVVGAKDSVPR